LPVRVGDEVPVYGELAQIGRTSMTIDVEAWQRDRTSVERSRVTQARFIFLAIDTDGQPRAIPPSDEADGFEHHR
jgi:acyl-CoA thioesterase YciA